MFLSLTMLAVALSLSVIAAWYSIAGLAAIFAAAVYPIIIMGGILELAKVVVTLWLHEHWSRCRLLMKCYLVPAVFMLMVITSMGIFGFLSKAHSDQTLISGAVQSKIAIYDEKIKTSRGNIEANRRALKQLDEAVDQSMARSTSETGADKAVAIRKGQTRERARLQAEIVAEQKTISKISEERAPIAAEIRKVEAEVGPIKYIAALIYGDNTDVNTLESAVRWVIIILVTVFDPLAIMMLLAATESLKWNREKQQQVAPIPVTQTVDTPDPDYDSDDNYQHENNTVSSTWPFPDHSTAPAYPPDDGPLTDEQIAQLKKSVEAMNLPTAPRRVQGDLFLDSDKGDHDDTHTQLPVDAVANSGVDEPTATTDTQDLDIADNDLHNAEDDSMDNMDAASKSAASRWKEDNPGLTLKTQRRLFESGLIKQLPWMTSDYYLGPTPDNVPVNNTVSGFGIEFPADPHKGDTHLRVDRLPSVLYKYNGSNWIEVDKELNNLYAYNEAYIDHLIAKIDSGEYDPDLLSTAERDQIEHRLTGQ
jgi:hypothetical protein